MSSKARLFVVLSVIVILSALPPGTPPALAFTEGSSNNFFGTGAGNEPTSMGFDNSYFGGSSGANNTTGARNSFFGANAGLNNTTGSVNVFVGVSAGAQYTDGTENAFFGNLAGFDNTASGNSFFGYSAGSFNTTGTSNAFFGSSAGLLNTTGLANSFFGRATGSSNTAGDLNAFFGAAAGLANTTGSNNAFFGQSAGGSNTTESGNTFVGALSNGVAGLTNATAVGFRARVSQSNSLVLGSIAGLNGAISSVKVGIGTATPSQLLHLTNNGAARFRIQNSDNGATWDFQSSGGGGSFVIDRVGGPASLDFEVQPDGDAVHSGSVTATSFITSSDRNLKTDITPAKAAKLMSLLRELDISTWRFKTDADGTVKLGPMAQDFHRLFGMGTSTTIDVRDLAALALVAAQELDEELRQEVTELKAAVAELMRRR